ncbi:MAG: hypothetical protein JWM84_4043 [Nocardioides sp.]|jgi:hypothetical protein|nr:hypothetical protein [Nocardioides sp.]
MRAPMRLTPTPTTIRAMPMRRKRRTPLGTRDDVATRRTYQPSRISTRDHSLALSRSRAVVLVARYLRDKRVR